LSNDYVTRVAADRWKKYRSDKHKITSNKKYNIIGIIIWLIKLIKSFLDGVGLRKRRLVEKIIVE
jgi:hypothetical protein